MLIWLVVFFSTTCFGEENLKLLAGSQIVSEKLKEVATKINNQYGKETLTIVIIMKGALFITTDLTRYLHMPLTFEYLNTYSYDKVNKNVRFDLSGLEHINFDNKHVLVIDDVFDSGNTILSTIAYLKKKKPKSIKTLVLLSMENTKERRLNPDFVLFKIGELDYNFLKNQKKSTYIVGYGIDYQEQYRELPGIYVLSRDDNKD
jgi:hypoxanthine phosphoribosyltransferase